MKIVTFGLGMLLGTIQLLGSSASAAESYDGCRGYIDSVPAVITGQGTWCLRKDLSTSSASAKAIDILVSNVTIDCNNFKLGGLGAGITTRATGINALNRSNITIRNCSVRGFLIGTDITGSGALVERNRFEGNTWIGIAVDGDGGTVRENLITDTGGTDYNDGFGGVGNRAIGVWTRYDVDVLDNTIATVVAAADSNGYAMGILAGENPSGSITGNRIRGMLTSGTGYSGAIALWGNTGRVTISDNHLVGNGNSQSYGVRCGEPESPNNAVVLDNVVNGLNAVHHNCSDAVGNYFRP